MFGLRQQVMPFFFGFPNPVSQDANQLGDNQDHCNTATQEDKNQALSEGCPFRLVDIILFGKNQGPWGIFQGSTGMESCCLGSLLVD